MTNTKNPFTFIQCIILYFYRVFLQSLLKKSLNLTHLKCKKSTDFAHISRSTDSVKILCLTNYTRSQKTKQNGSWYDSSLCHIC